uniref:Serpentine receptor class gamma n=1 Tax=Elaeophora elaphi TaxID=1147741 RepID=A0A0R3RP22_9BILA
MAAYGIASATEIVFYSYIYAKVTKEQYKRQTIILLNIGTYLTINQVALISPIIVFIIGIYLPQVQWKLLFERAKINNENNQFNEPTSYLQFVKYRIEKILFDLEEIYAIKFVRKWSL